MQSSKNTIWKQITTSKGRWWNKSFLYAIFKEHNLKANHNAESIYIRRCASVCNLQRTQSESKSQHGKCHRPRPLICMQSSKNTIWKQITTWHRFRWDANSLYAIFKEHNLKANHNSRIDWMFAGVSVCNLQRTQSESKSQHNWWKVAKSAICMQSSKNTIWKQITTLFLLVFLVFILYAIFKEHNLKANHNTSSEAVYGFASVCNLQRTQSESKSQQWDALTTYLSICMQSSKNTIWKQITTVDVILGVVPILYAIFKEHNLKANHNRNSF